MKANSDFCLITKKALKKDFEIHASERVGSSVMTEMICFDQSVKERIIKETEGNIDCIWNGRNWVQ